MATKTRTEVLRVGPKKFLFYLSEHDRRTEEAIRSMAGALQREGFTVRMIYLNDADDEESTPSLVAPSGHSYYGFTTIKEIVDSELAITREEHEQLQH